ncbi:MAG: hypothetical protein IPI20_09345 [Rhodoferax sp.]|nr:hypothetical protein [Rhodoferax sp.]
MPALWRIPGFLDPGTPSVSMDVAAFNINRHRACSATDHTGDSPHSIAAELDSTLASSHGDICSKRAGTHKRTTLNCTAGSLRSGMGCRHGFPDTRPSYPTAHTQRDEPVGCPQVTALLDMPKMMVCAKTGVVKQGGDEPMQIIKINQV